MPVGGVYTYMEIPLIIYNNMFVCLYAFILDKQSIQLLLILQTCMYIPSMPVLAPKFIQHSRKSPFYGYSSIVINCNQATMSLILNLMDNTKGTTGQVALGSNCYEVVADLMKHERYVDLIIKSCS